MRAKRKREEEEEEEDDDDDDQSESESEGESGGQGEEESESEDDTGKGKGKGKGKQQGGDGGVTAASTTTTKGSTATGKVTDCVALDCEMVGTGPDGRDDALAHVAIVNSEGAVVYESYVAVPDRITDYRTRYSGIRRGDLVHAPPFSQVQAEVAKILAGRRLIGHALRNDLAALQLQHPYTETRDTADYPPFRGSAGKPQKLSKLAATLLGVSIQSQTHSPVEDARAAMLLYLRHEAEWESWLAPILRLKLGKRRRKEKKASSASAVVTKRDQSKNRDLKRLR